MERLLAVEGDGGQGASYLVHGLVLDRRVLQQPVLEIQPGGQDLKPAAPELPTGGRLQAGVELQVHVVVAVGVQKEEEASLEGQLWKKGTVVTKTIRLHFFL